MAKKASRKRKRKTPEFRRARNENRLGMTAAMLVIVIMTFAVGVNSVSLREKEAKYAAREEELLRLIEIEEARSEELVDLETYTKTKKYVEEVAKDKLGLVYEHEIIFQEVD